MTVEQRKIDLINQITSLEDESLLIRMKELINDSTEELPNAIKRLLDESSQSTKRTEYPSVRDILK